MRVLLIEEDNPTADRLTSALEDQHFEVDRVRRVGEAIKHGQTGRYCGVLIGMMAEREHVRQVIHELREAEVIDPLLVLGNAKNSEQVVELLDAGADDCLAQPYELGELMARLRAMIRRCEPGEGAVLTFSDLELDLASRRVSRSGQPIRLTAKELGLLEFFVRHPNRVLSRKEIGHAVWDAGFDPESNVIDVFISKLRNKIDKPFEAPYLHTLVGAGYMLSTTEPGA